MSTDATKTLLTRFLCATELEILSWFAGLQGAYISKSNKYVYIPGQRDDRILLVAHADTASKKNTDESDIAWFGDVCMRKDVLYDGWNYGSEPLGADDRAGCAMLWNNHDGQHSLLVTTGEEKGLLGARAASAEIGKELQKHVFSIEIDRKGDRHAVFYDVATPEFKAHMLKLLNDNNPDEQPWQERHGSCTDISHICESTRICGVNLSAGYLREHSGDEMLLLTAWLNTQSTLAGILKEPKHLSFRLPVAEKKGLEKYRKWFHDWCGEHVCYKMDCESKHRQVYVIVLPGGKKLEIPLSVSKKRFKKLGRKIRQLVDKGELTKGEGERITQELQENRDGKPAKRLQIVTTRPQPQAGETWTG